jgi:hypothetical protein
LDSLYNGSGNVIWYSRGQRLNIQNRHNFNKELSQLCNSVYFNTPIYKNELINKTKVSGQVSQAKRKLLGKLINELDQPNLAFEAAEFPPEKSIYLSLLRETGIHKIIDRIGILQKPTNKSFEALWEAGEMFLESSKNKERNIQELIDILSIRPFKLKRGFIDFWIPIFLLSKQDDFALFEGEIYIPEITIDVFELMSKKVWMFSIKAFDVAGVKLQLFNRYRIFLNQVENHNPTNKTFIQTIRPFLTFYRELPDYAKKTNRLNKNSINIRKVIATAKDPEKAFFDDFPSALGYSIFELQNNPAKIEPFLKKLQEAVKELRTCFDMLIDRIEDFLVIEILGTKAKFPDYKYDIRNRFSHLKTHLLLQHQKSFILRINSELDDRKGWLSSIAQSVIGKSLTIITDEDEIILFDKIKDIFYELDNLSDISTEQALHETEEILKLEITSFVSGLNKNLLRIPKAKAKEVDHTIEKLKNELGKDKKLNIAALTKLLQQLLNNE